MKKPSTASLRYIALLLGTVGLLWSTSILHADPRQWGPSGIPIRQGHHIEWQRAAYVDANGYTMLVWSDTRTGDRDVFAQLIEPDGDLAPGWPVHVIEFPYRQEDPEPIVTDGGFIITWIDFRHDSTGDVFAQKLNYAGQMLWNPLGVIVDTNTTSMTNETSLRGATDGAGGAIIAWEDNRNGDNADIFAQRINSNGQVAAGWTANVPLPVTNSAGVQNGITADTDGRGNLIVGWNDNRDGGNVFAAKITNNRQLPWGGEGGTVVCNFTGQQSSLKLCPDLTTSGAYFVWADQRNGSSNDLFMQRFDSLGNRVWNPDGLILCDAPDDQKGARITPDMSGGAQVGVLTCWQDVRVNGSVEEVYAQKTSPAGTHMWTANGVKICGDAGPNGVGASRDNSRLTSDLAGGGLYVWDDTRHEPGNNLEYNSYSTHLNSAGGFICGECGVAINTGDNQQQEAVLRVSPGADFYTCIYADFYRGSRTMRVAQISLSNCSVERDQEFVYGLDGDATNPVNIRMVIGNVAFVWEDSRGGNAGKQIYYQVLDTTKAFTFEHIPVNGAPIAPMNAGNAQFDQGNPSICQDGTGGFFCCFDNLADGTRLIRLQQVNRNGYLACDQAGSLVSQSNVDQRNAQVVSDGADGCFVVWSGFDANFQLDVFAMRMGQNCEALWAEPVLLSSNPTNDDNLASITAVDGGCCVAVWQTGEFGQFDIRAAKVCGDGTVAWENPVCTFPGVQSEPQVVSDEQGGAYFAWADERDEILVKDIYGQHFNAEGDRQWTNGGRVIVTANEDQKTPRMAVDSQGRVFVSWLDYRNGNNLDLYAKKLNPDGSSVWPEATGRVICQATSDQSDQQMLVEWNEGLYMVWDDGRTVQYSDLFGVHINEATAFTDSWWGTPGETEHLGGPVNQEYQNQNQSNLAHDWHGGTVAVWVDWRSSGKEPLQNIWGNWINDYTVSVHEVPAPLPNEYALQQNYPNPFNPSTEFKFTIPATEAVKVAIYNTLGQQVRTLVDGVMHAGTYVVTFDASELASGVYYYRLETPSFQTVRKMQLIR